MMSSRTGLSSAAAQISTRYIKPGSRWRCWEKNKRYRFADVQRRHFNSTAGKRFPPAAAEEVIELVQARTTAAVDVVAARLPAEFPQRIVDTIFAGIARNAEVLGDMPKN